MQIFLVDMAFFYTDYATKAVMWSTILEEYVSRCRNRSNIESDLDPKSHSTRVTTEALCLASLLLSLGLYF